MPLIAVALIYLVIVIFLSKMLGKLEGRMSRRDTH
jgi:ABC-type amino acid transport system permease subunit